MLHRIIQFSVQNKLIVGIAVLGLIVWGIVQVRQLPVDALPDITSNQVQVITISPALAAPEVERLVTFTVEQACANIPGISEMRSISRFGLSVVTIVFNDKTDVYWARQQVAERLTRIKEQIPRDAGLPELAPLTTGLGEVYQYVVKPAKGYEGQFSLADLRSIQDWIVRRQLIGTPGVADVSSFGGHLKQYEIAIEPSRLKSMGVTIDEVFDAIAMNNQNSGGAFLEKGQEVLFIRTEGLAATVADIAGITIKQASTGAPIKIGDVADVQIGRAIRYGAVVYGNQGEVVGSVVLMLKGANGMEVVNNVKARLEEIKKSLPEGVEIETFYDRSKMVGRAISTVKNNLMEGALIVVFVLVVFLGNLRAGLIVASVIPLAMLFAVCMMNLFGVSGNLMSLGALDFGLIVDGAVIIVEAVLHRLHIKRTIAHVSRITQEDLDHEVVTASSRMMNAAVFGQIIILIVYFPILALVGIEGKMFRPMAQTVAFALIGAFLLSVTYVPAVSAMLISKKIHAENTYSDRVIHWLQKHYATALQFALRFSRTVVTTSLVLFTITVIMLTRLGGEFIPELEEGDFAVDTRLLTGSSLPASIEANRLGADLLLEKYPEIEKIVCRIGSSEIPTDPMPVEMSDMIILLKDKKEWTSAKGFDELANKMSETLSNVPGMTAGFQFPVQMRFNELISGARQDVVCKIFGEDLDTLAAIAHNLGALAVQVDGAKDMFVETVTGLPQIVVKYNRQALAMYHVDVQDLNRMIRTAFAGESAGLIYENERRYDVVVRLKDQSRTDVQDVRNLQVYSPIAGQIPMSLLADVEIKEGPNQIQREDAKRRIIVAFNVRGRDVESVVKDLQTMVDKRLRLPAGYYIHYGGAFENLKAAKERLAIAVPAALLLIFLLLFFAFGALRHAFLVFTAIPLSSIGGVLALYTRGMPFSISAGVGFIALFGVSVLNGIVLITEFNRLKTESTLTMNEIISRGTASRLRPVLMTAAVASLGFLPMALSKGAGAEVQRPLASVVIGGLITATFLTLFVLPILYRWIEHRNWLGTTKVVAPVLLLMLAPASLFSQQSLTVKQAVDTAVKYNPALRVSRLQQDYYGALVGTAKEVPKTFTGVEFGQTNSANFDTRFSLTQSFMPVGSIKRHQAALEALQQVAKSETQLKQSELELVIRSLYNEFLFQSALESALARQDSIYGVLLQKARLRLEKGEVDVLEKAGWQQQASIVLQQRQEAAASRKRIVAQLRHILLANYDPLPAGSFEKMDMQLAMADTALVDLHPLLAARQEQYNAAQAFTAYEKARNNPELSVGYNNQSLIGVQTQRDGTEKYYDGGSRFHTGQVGVHLPLFNKAGKARVQASAAMEEVKKAEVESEREMLRQQYAATLEQLAGLQNQMNTYINQIAPAANQTLQAAMRKYQLGEIEYTAWMLHAKPALEAQITNLEKIFQYNQSIITLLYLTGKATDK